MAFRQCARRKCISLNSNFSRNFGFRVKRIVHPAKSIALVLLFASPSFAEQGIPSMTTKPNPGTGTYQKARPQLPQKSTLQLQPPQVLPPERINSGLKIKLYTGSRYFVYKDMRFCVQRTLVNGNFSCASPSDYVMAYRIDFEIPQDDYTKGQLSIEGRKFDFDMTSTNKGAMFIKQIQSLSISVMTVLDAKRHCDGVRQNNFTSISADYVPYLMWDLHISDTKGKPHFDEASIEHRINIVCIY